MQVSQRCQYSLRALFELAKRQGAGPVATSDIADAQAIPPRFLDAVLQNLKRTGYVQVKRGNQGGYLLAVPPETITIGSIVRSVEGSLAPVTCCEAKGDACCRLKGKCVFMSIWNRVEAAAEKIYDNTTLFDLMCEESSSATPTNSPAYFI